jgi:murein DD-endopeptidase MepM/ murein hydrolase activator NlpD
MGKKKWKYRGMRAGTMVLCALILLLVLELKAYGITSDSIREKEAEIAAAEEESQRLQGSISDLESIKQNLEASKKDLEQYVAALDIELTEIAANILDLKGQIADKEKEIEVTALALDEAKELEAKQYEAMKNRIRYIYEHGEENVLEILFRSKDFSDFLNKVLYQQRIQEYDQNLLEEYQMNREYIALCAEQLQLEKDNLDLRKQNVETEEANMQALMEEKGRKITEFETDIHNKEQAIQQYEDDLAAQKELITATEAAIAEEKRKLLASGGSVIHFDGGMFSFPMASYTRISDEYGYRIHPILGVEQFHNGVDLAAPAGTAIYAAYDGKVVAAAYSGSMGNYVMIDHGDGLYTIYMHASALYIAEGAIVVKGETIAAVGSTGRSTGNHLHFSVRLNGSYVSPWNYLKQ